MDKKNVVMVLPTMAGGGAERVAALLTNEFHKSGYGAKFVLTQVKPENLIKRDLNEDIPLILLREKYAEIYAKKDYLMFPVRLFSSAVSKIFEKAKKRVPAFIAYLSFVSLYRREIKQVRGMMKEDENADFIAFLQPTIPIVLLAARGLKNRVIFSERDDPKRLIKKRYGWNFIKKYYQRADAVVFQTQDAKDTYPESISKKGTVITNPIKGDLPLPYCGERNNFITTFCRISNQKNLPLLLRAFKLLHADHPEYVLKIIGDSNNKEGDEIKKNLCEYIKENGLGDFVKFEPFRPNVHEGIIRDAMYVNSSDTEGISNAMLEAMAIGMPSVCTDCPIGGAKQTITDGENGLLVPIKDENALYLAMKRVIEEEGLKEKLSLNAAKVREEMSLEKIAKKWIGLL
ncbi:MAG: glycosyltransferase [Clostridia bacterium]|nr:glycosyltransferase [Clostridia bacterium]